MRSGGLIATMRKALAVIAILYLTVACCPCRKAGASTIVDKVERDSVYVAHYDTLRIVERDTMWLERIEQSHDRVMVNASRSYLENAYCYTSADVNEDGVLTHTLDTRDSALLPVRYEYRERVVRDTIYRNGMNVSNSRTTRVKEVRKAAWYDKCLRIVSAALFVIVLWQNKKRIIQLIHLWRI